MRDHGRAIRMRVGRTVRRLRLSRGMSQERLAELVGNSGKHIGQIERGEVNVGLDVLSSIAAALSADVADLFGEPRRRRTIRDTTITLTRRDLDLLGAMWRRIRSQRAPRATRSSG
jgi:transcriptional regulator with XRE-family HTH domain